LSLPYKLAILELIQAFVDVNNHELNRNSHTNQNSGGNILYNVSNMTDILFFNNIL